MTESKIECIHVRRRQIGISNQYNSMTEPRVLDKEICLALFRNDGRASCPFHWLEKPTV